MTPQDILHERYRGRRFAFGYPATPDHSLKKDVYKRQVQDYTQGLFIHDSILYEVTGTYGGAELRKTDLRTGQVIARTALPADMFGEGIAMLSDKVYQLTWQEERVMIYDAATLKKTGELPYAGEGWGLTSDGKKLYMSDGSDRIYVMDPASFARTGTIRVRIDGSPVMLSLIHISLSTTKPLMNRDRP